jgi:hypothetical protein
MDYSYWEGADLPPSLPPLQAAFWCSARPAPMHPAPQLVNAIDGSCFGQPSRKAQKRNSMTAVKAQVAEKEKAASAPDR